MSGLMTVGYHSLSEIDVDAIVDGNTNGLTEGWMKNQACTLLKQVRQNVFTASLLTSSHESSGVKDTVRKTRNFV